MNKITTEDYYNSHKNYESMDHCPLAVAMKRILHRSDISVGMTSIIAHKPTFEHIGNISPAFLHEDFLELKEKGKEFEFEYIPFKEVQHG